MEKTLREHLEDLLTMQVSSIELTRLSGNNLAPPIWKITLCQTHGGEMFRFAQVDYTGRTGSGVYCTTIAEAESYGREVVREMFKSSARSARFGIPDRAGEYDWYGRGSLLELTEAM